MASKRETKALQQYYDELLEKQLAGEEPVDEEDIDNALEQEEGDIPEMSDPDASADEQDQENTEKVLAVTLAALRSRDVVSAISEYSQLKKRYDPKLYPEYTAKYAGMTAEELLEHYLDPGIDQREKKWLREQIYLFMFFLLPYAVHKKYTMRSAMFSDAMQNLSVIVLQAMDLFKPGNGWKFSDYLIGYFRGGIARTFKDSTVVDTYSARKRALEQLKKEREEAGLPEPEEVIPKESYGTISFDSLEADACLDDYTRQKYSILRSVENIVSVGDVNAMDHTIHSQELKDWLEEGLSEASGVLTRDEARVLIMYYGLYGNREHIYSEIAEIRRQEGLGFACSRISQIKTKAIEKLRAWFEANGIREE